MQLRSIKKKLAITGSGLAAASLISLPLATPASAATAAPLSTIGQNAAVEVQTEYDCNTHNLRAEVKNKLESDINPTVRFEKFSDQMPGYPPTHEIDVPIKPGERQIYMYSFSGNNRLLPVSVAVDGYEEVKVEPTVNCSEPVSFTVTQYGTNSVIGTLTNNNSLYPQTVTITPGFGGQRQDITLEPSESIPLVAIPFTSYPNQQGVSLLVTNGPNFQSSYYVDLTKPLSL